MESEKIEYANEEELKCNVYTHLQTPDNLQLATEYILNSLIDEQVLGTVLELHYNLKTGTTTRVHRSTCSSNMQIFL